MNTVVMRPMKEARTMVRTGSSVAVAQFARELAIFTAAMSKQPQALLATLTEDAAPLAQQVATALVSGSSAERQAKLASTFGLRADARERLRAVVCEAGPTLRNEILRVVPVWMRSWLEDLASFREELPAAPLVTALAERLVREATR